MAVRMANEVDLTGTVLAGRYRISERIGGGGMGTVYAGEHVEMGRKLAIKVLRPDVTLRPTLVERFKREARAASSIDHENIVDCIDVGSTDAGLIYYVMEQLRGEDLHQRLRREKTQAWPRARAITMQICRALAAAHEKGIVHRDLKPGNIFLVQRGDSPDFVKLLDFGIAKITDPAAEDDSDALTALGEVIGTTPYMAPEQAAGEAIDHRIDVYATGVILFQMLSGRLPFPGKTPRQVLTAILTSELPALAARNPALRASPALEALLRRCMHRDRDARFPDMLALHTALARLPDDACRLVETDEVAATSDDALPTSIASVDLQFSELVAAAEANTQHPQLPHGAPLAPALVAPPPERPRHRGRLLATAGLTLVAITVWIAVPRDSSTPAPTPDAALTTAIATPAPPVAPRAACRHTGTARATRRAQRRTTRRTTHRAQRRATRRPDSRPRRAARARAIRARRRPAPQRGATRPQGRAPTGPHPRAPVPRAPRRDGRRHRPLRPRRRRQHWQAPYGHTTRPPPRPARARRLRGHGDPDHAHPPAPHHRPA
jgi:serine/threonine protein kinase